jgi:hypothetical protein
MMSTMTVTAVVWLLVLSPALLYFMESWYKSTEAQKLANERGFCNRPMDRYVNMDRLRKASVETCRRADGEREDIERLESEGVERPDVVRDKEHWKASMIARRDVHVVLISYVLEAVAQICIGLARNGTQMILGKSAFCFV